MRVTSAVLFCSLLALSVLTVSACGRDAVINGGLGESCFSPEDCVEGLRCVDGLCVGTGLTDDPGDPDEPDRPDEPDEPVCQAGTTFCIDDETVGFCIDGFEVEEFDFCEDGVCQDGGCVRDVECFEGERRCAGLERVEICERGRFVSFEECVGDAACRNGQCQRRDEELPDIVIDNFEFSPRTAEVGGNIALNMRVSNRGDASAPGFQCVINGSQSGDVNPARDTRFGQLSFGRLGAGERDGRGFRLVIEPNVRPGDYLLYLFCDFADDVRESNEQNNIFINEVPLTVERRSVEGADLFIEFAFVEDDVVGAGSSLPLFVTLCNLGEEDVRSTLVAVQLLGIDDREIVADLGIYEVPPLLGGECREEVLFTEPVFCPEDAAPIVLPRLIIDPFNQVDEVDEDNNEYVVEGILAIDRCSNPQECLPDELEFDSRETPPTLEFFEVYELTICPNDTDTLALPAGPGEQVELRLETAPGNPLTVGVFADFGRDRGFVDEIEVGAFGTFEGTLTVPDDAQRLILSIASRGLLTPEYVVVVEPSGPDNGRPDIAVEDAEIPDDVFEAGESFNVALVAVNEGQGDAASHDYTVFLTRNPRDPDSRVQIGQSIEPRLGAGEVRDVFIFSTIPSNFPGGEAFLIIEADAFQEIPEANEFNNIVRIPIFIEGGGLACVADRFEPNDTEDQATDIEDGQYDDLVVCGGRNGDDFFRVCPPAGSSVTFRVTFDGEQGDIDLRLFDDRGEFIDGSDGVGNRERVFVGDTQAGTCYLLEVFLFGGQDSDEAAAYSLTVDVESPVIDECTEALEPNNTFDQAASLEEAVEQPVLDFCPRGDSDFYAVELAAGTVFTVRATPLGEQPPGDIVLALHDPNFVFLLQRFERAPELTLDVPEDGTYYLRLVTSSGAELFQYNLDVVIE